MKNIGIGLLVLIAIFLFPLCSLAGPKYGGTLVFGMASDLKQLDPHKTMTTPEGRYFRLMSEPLVDSDDRFAPAPCLAESWEIAPDGLSWTFKIREGVKFHNGREMTAEDVKWNFDRILDPKTAAALRGRIQAVESVEVLERYRVKVNLKRPSAAFASNLYGSGGFMGILAPESLESDGTVTKPIGTGPFRFVEWKPNEHVKYAKFEDYWQKGKPYLDGVIVKTVPDFTVRLAALRTGQLDMAYKLNVDEVTKLGNSLSKEIVFDMTTPDWTIFVFFNSAKKPFSDLRMRKAVALAINKSEVLLGVFQGHGEIVNQVFTRNSEWYCDLKETKQDVELAKKLVKEAGYDAPIDVEMACSSTYPDTVALAQILQMQLRPIGINIKMIVEDWPTHVKRDQAGKFDLGAAGWSVTADPETLYPIAFSEKGPLGFLHPGYSNPKMWELIDKGGSLQKFEERKAVYAEVGRMIIDEAPWIWILSSPNAYGWRAEVKGFKPVIGHQIYVGGGLQETWLDR